MSIEDLYGRQKYAAQTKANRQKNGEKVAHIDPSFLPESLVTLTRIDMNYFPLVPEENPGVALKRNRRGFVTTPRIRTVAYLGGHVLRPVLVCAYCQKEGTETLGPDGLKWELDHVTPLCKGGRENLSNLVKCCHTCNKLKGTRHDVAPHPTAPWAAKDPQMGLMLWLNAKEVRRNPKLAVPFTIEVASDTEMDLLISQWKLTQFV